MGIVMERTQADIVDAALFERDEFRHHLFYLGGVHDTCYRRFVYHYSNPLIFMCKENANERKESLLSICRVQLFLCKGTINL